MSVQDINHVTLTGRVVEDSTLKVTQGGRTLLRFSIASNERRTNPQTGELEDYPNFINCAIFGKYAESAQRLIKKGVPVSVDGHLRFTKWQQDGQTRTNLEVFVDRIVAHDRYRPEAVRNGQPR